MKKFKFSLNGNDYNVEVNSFESKGAGELAKVIVNNKEYEVEIYHEKSKTPIMTQKPLIHSIVERRQITEQQGSEKLSTIKAPIPGVIIKVNNKIGDKIKMGETVIVLEAMKMQNEIQSPREGVIKKIYVETGSTVFEGDTLFELE